MDDRGTECGRRRNHATANARRSCAADRVPHRREDRRTDSGESKIAIRLTQALSTSNKARNRAPAVKIIAFPVRKTTAEIETLESP